MSGQCKPFCAMCRYYKNLSLQPYVDPFTGEAQGSAAPVSAAAAAARDQRG